MKTKSKQVIWVLIAVGWLINFQAAQAENKKLAQTGFQFLSVTSDARAGAMGEAMTTLLTHSSALFFNPAGMARLPQFIDLSFSQNHWIADINYNTLSLAIRPAGGRYGVFGFSILSVDYGELQGTMVWENEQGYLDTELFYPSAFSIGFGYAKALSDKFSVGGQIKSARQYLGRNVVPVTDTTNAVIKNIAEAVAFDFGTVYRTGWKSFTFGMSVRNFSNEIKYQSEGFQLPLTFRIGASMDLFDLWANHPQSQSLLFSIDALHPRSYAERLNVGLEYTLWNLLSIRSGYLYNYDYRGMTAGFGIHKNIAGMFVGIDYAYTPFGLFDSVQRFSVQLRF
jgi:hypothetical protein